MKIVKIKGKKAATKFKIRCSKYIYTMTVRDATKAQKIGDSLPPGLTKVEIGKK